MTIAAPHLRYFPDQQWPPAVTGRPAGAAHWQGAAYLGRAVRW
ncbi:hypothetical protein ACFRR6_01505 [Streptomyces sp. NPDC056891]